MWFCAIFVDVLSETEVSVRLTGDVPAAPSVSTWIKSNGGSLAGKALTFSIEKGEESALLSLAAAIEAIVAPGKRYSVASYKYMCPRTAKSLRKLASELHGAWDA
ncbi:MAG: hypothetical protein DMF60_17395 [Acidobacteria bacterium]|nr:MAG: hypothetical protein DMF60_17395 [Acidobacteriota bacterium]